MFISTLIEHNSVRKLASRDIDMTIFKQTINSQNTQDFVVLHGWGGVNHRYMQPITDLLKNHYRVTILDLPGMGKSPWNNQIKTLDNMLELLLPHFPQKASYIGWSFGGLLSMLIAAKYPHRVERIISLGATPKFVEDKNWPGIPYPGFTPDVLKFEPQGQKGFMQAFIKNEFEGLEKNNPYYDKVLEIMNISEPTSFDILMKGIAIVDSTNLREEFRQIQCPIDFIMGENDACVPAAAFEKIKQLNPKTQIHVISAAKHMFQWTHPKEFTKILNAIVKN